MKTIADQIEACIQQDPGKRGLAEWAVQGDLLPAAQSLVKSDHVVIGTGFYILTAQTIETDGPPGAIILAHALRQLGKRVCLVVDEPSEHIMKAGLAVLESDTDLVTAPVNQVLSPALILKRETTHFVALERPGKARDGNYYNFRGKDISPWVASLDEAFLHARAIGICTIGIGDGGNELGMGKVAPAVDTHIAPGRPYACITPADLCLCAGVSNWAGYGLSALLSALTGQNLLPPPSHLQSLLAAIVDAGAVDGVTGGHQPTVDGLDGSWEQGIYSELIRFIS